MFELENNEYKADEAFKRLNNFISRWQMRYPSMKRIFNQSDYQNYFAYLEFPFQIQRMIYTTNWIERLNKGIKRTTRIRSSFPSSDSAQNLICAYLIDFEQSVYKYPVTSFAKVQDILNNKLNGGGLDTINWTLPKEK